jgi:hypothetical protein
MHESESPADVARWLEQQSVEKWPAILGSLSLRRSPCMRRNCRACQSGEQQQSYLLYGRIREHRVSIYIAEDKVPEVQRALDNGRAIRGLLYEAGERYANALKRQRLAAEAG